MQLQRTLLVTMIALVITLLAACTAPAPSATGEGQAAASGPQQGALAGGWRLRLARSPFLWRRSSV